MKEYVLAVIAFCLVSGALSAVSVGGVAERIALGIITLFIIVSPIKELVSEANLDSLGHISHPSLNLDGCDGVIEDAFANGIARAVAEKFDLDSEDIGVILSGFEAENMRADKIHIILSGMAALASPLPIERYVNEMNVGVCKVEIQIG